MDGFQVISSRSTYCRPYLDRLSALLAATDAAAVDEAIDVIRRVWERGGQIITLGNGGSAMTALHFATDWSKGVFMATGRRFRARSLVDNMGVITAYANDVSFQDVFAEQLRNIAVQGDLVLAISGSGNSENVIRAIDYANGIGCETLGLCGFSGGRLKAKAHYVVHADVNDMQLCEDVHAIFGHIVMQALCGMTD
ncbi:SIS domain-containing protein [Roseomonas sp. NAR14]|uniref:SIS domain-containing protein n=1 Tax=Roseomonas acroporae TaxID=2937791 RepID=A0A9X2BXP4_9PROT|nr:SIS domain-containing protein [Roseomonas acroporae]MCK8785175.1 SIS domain-containing protein [Roseomonas acroporae]